MSCRYSNSRAPVDHCCLGYKGAIAFSLIYGSKYFKVPLLFVWYNDFFALFAMYRYTSYCRVGMLLSSIYGLFSYLPKFAFYSCYMILQLFMLIYMIHNFFSPKTNLPSSLLKEQIRPDLISMFRTFLLLEAP